jgi:hypothetical protein|nr:hypothetical protein [Neorhizobium tomejilense]
MKSTSLALIDIEAEATGKRLVPATEVAKVSEALGIQVIDPPVAMDEETKAAVEAMMGKSVSMTASELAALRRSVRSLSAPCPPESFVWGAVEGPEDVERLMRAVIVYHRFNVQAVEISERIGANDEFRRFVRQCQSDGETPLAEALDAERRRVEHISSFMESLRAFVEKADKVFGKRDWPIGAILALTAAARGLAYSRQVLETGWDLPHEPSPECLDEIENLRIELAYAAGEVRDSHGLNLLGYSLSTLSGVRRSLFEGGADFGSALENLGVVEDGEERLLALAANIKAFMETCDRLGQALKDNGYTESQMADVTSMVLVRKYLMAGAEACGVEWGSVASLLSPLPGVAAEDMTALFAALEADRFSAKLASISEDRGQAITSVVLAAEHYVFSRQYWIDAGDRVLACDSGIRLMDIRAILEMEPEIHGNTEVLTHAGAMDREDVGKLEEHLEWMIGIYALPVSNAAIGKIVETRGKVLQGLG